MRGTAPKLTIAVVWSDPDIQEIRLSAASELFAGQVNFYAGYQELKEFAASIQGFPVSDLDVREYKFGQENLGHYGTASIHLRCEDSTGHLIADVTLRCNLGNPIKPSEAALVQVRFVPSDLDRFVEHLRHIDNQVGAVAVLTNTP